ncbi:unnamed protein product [Rodentolepis nana]|uniref:WD domain-containing protein n=1 Tax=Rodentolepis nana TaxID=102285 RepID=A0A0R3TN26_RODNA|nr:unnamed protein product [Rodentolepis nana]
MSIPPSQAAEMVSSVRAGTVADEVNGVRTKNLGKRDVEMVRLIGQYLCDKGYSRAYNELAEDTGIVLEHQSATDLRNAILEGRWDDTEVAVNALAESIGNASVLQHIRFLLLEQQYLELLEEDDPVPALKLLRSHITPLKPDNKRLYNLTECLMCRSKEDLYRQAGGWDGKDGHSRTHLVESIQRFMPAQTMLPPSRLETIVAESVRSQLGGCLFHLDPVSWNSPIDDISILQPHACSIMDFPVFPVQKIEQRDSELYFSVFSPDGNYLAVAGKESSLQIYKVDKARHFVSPNRSLTVESSVSHLCWSPDSKKIAVCHGSRPGPVVVFDVASRRKICQKHEKADDVYITAAFFADGRKLAFGGLKGGCFYIIDTEDEGRVLFSHDYCRVQCMVAFIPPPSSFGCLIPTPLDLDPSASRCPSTTSTNANTPSIDHSGFVHAVDQLLIVDHMYRIRLFRFGYALPPSNTGDAHAASANAAGMEQMAADAASVATMTTGMWTTATAAASQGGAGGVTPIIMALQTALFPHQQHRAQLRAGGGGLPPPPIRQSTSDSSFGIGVGFGSSRLQTPAAIPSAASASTPGSLVGLPGQVLVQIQPNPGFALPPFVQSGSNVLGSVPNLMAAQIGAPGYSLESLSTFPTIVSSIPGLMHQYYMRYAGMPSSATGPRPSTSAGLPGASSSGSSIRPGASIGTSSKSRLLL